MRSEDTLVIALCCLTLSTGCVRKKGDTGDDTGGETHDHTPPFELGSSYAHTFQAHIVPNEVGQAFGLSECDAQMTATLTPSSTATPCPDCDALYSGPVTSTYSDCSGVSFSDGPLSYGLAVEGRSFHVWTYDEKGGTWTDHGLAQDLGDGVYELIVTEEMGDESFSLGEMTSTYTFDTP